MSWEPCGNVMCLVCSTRRGARFVTGHDGITRDTRSPRIPTELPAPITEPEPLPWQQVEIHDTADRLARESVELLCTRHMKYGPRNIAASPGGPLNGLRVRLYDKLARLNHALDSGETTDFIDDSFRDCFADIVGYGLIGLMVIDGEWPGL
jgi:hypothetical protein